MPDTSSFLYALFLGAESVRFDGEVFDRPENATFDAGYQYVDAVSADRDVAFVFGVMEDADRDDWKDARAEPTAVLYRNNTLILIWAFARPPKVAEVEALAEAIGMDGVDDLVPLPGANGWELLHAVPDACYSLDELTQLYGSAAPAAEPKSDVAPWEDERWGDAVVKTPFNENDPILAEPIIVSLGRNSLSTQWKPQEMPRGKLMAMFAQHKVGDKDGPSILLGDMVPGPRKKSAIKSLHVLGLDLDDGVPTEEIDAALAKLGVLAIRYSTHSHLKSTSDVNRDALIKWAEKHGPEEYKVDDDLVRLYLEQKAKLDPRIVKSARIADEVHRSEGRFLVISHVPIAKHRIIVPLKVPFVIDDEGQTAAAAMEKWAKVPQALADKLGVKIDKACLDVSRLFYLPRHPKGGAFETSLFGGGLFDWRDLDLEDIWGDELAKMNRSQSKSQTEAGRALGRWSMKAAHGFQIVTAVEDNAPEKMRGGASNGITCECPFDEDHSNPGDPDDVAFFCVNAGDGPGEIFTAHCRHESCREYTNLDFLGKMIEDAWFDKEVLEDETYNLAELEDAPSPDIAKKIDTQDKAREAYEDAIDALGPDSPSDEIDDAIRLVVESGLNNLKQEGVWGVMKTKLGVSLPALRKQVNVVRNLMMADQNDGERVRDPKGRLVFSHNGEFNFDEAYDACYRALLKANREADEPVFSCLQDKPVRLRTQEDGRIVFDEITSARTLWSELNERVTFVRKNEQGDGARGQVPIDVGNHVYEQAWRKLPQTPEIVYTPCYAPNGDLIRKPGYYRDLNVLMPATDLVVPKVFMDPTAEEVEDAVSLLRDDLLADFPFLDIDGDGEELFAPSAANALAMLITPFMRRMVDGCTPLFFISKPEPGTGGTALGLIPILLYDGNEPAPLRYTQNEEEMQKMLLAAILETRSSMFFDDVREFNNRALLQSLTARHIGGRVLGATKTVERPNTFNWIATGNNPDIKSEMGRRVVVIRLNLKNVDVQNRKFRHEHLFTWVKDNRGDLVHAILTLIAHWQNCGAPEFKLRSRASFEDWAAKVGGVLQCAGIEGFLDNPTVVLADVDEAAVQEFVHEWLRRYGTGNPQTLAELFAFALDAQLDICDGNTDDQKKSRFTKARLPSMRDRTFKIGGEAYMVQSGNNAAGAAVYSLRQLEQVEEPA